MPDSDEGEEGTEMTRLKEVTSAHRYFGLLSLVTTVVSGYQYNYIS